MTVRSGNSRQPKRCSPSASRQGAQPDRVIVSVGASAKAAAEVAPETRVPPTADDDAACFSARASAGASGRDFASLLARPDKASSASMLADSDSPAESSAVVAAAGAGSETGGAAGA